MTLTEKTKCCWLAKHHKKGWRVGIALNDNKMKYLPIWFESEKVINRILKKKAIVFVYMSDDKPKGV